MHHITTTSTSTDTLSGFAILAAALAAVALIVVHFLPTGVNPISEAVSDYGAGKYKNFYRVAAFWLGASGLLLAISLGEAIFPKPTLVIVMLLIFAATRATITIFPTDLPDEEESSVGRAHLVLAAAAFGSIAIAAGTFHTTVQDEPFWHAHDTLIAGLGYAVVVLAIATALTRRLVLKNYFGLVERLLYVAMIAWIVTVAGILLAG
jgi:hypothetical protein